jgi:hypothetical protein
VLSFDPGLLLDGALGMRHGLEASVWNRLSALDRQPVPALLDSLLSPCDRLQLVLEPVDQRSVTLLLEQLGAGVGVVLVDVRKLAVVAVPGPQLGELPLDALAFSLQKGSRTVQVHSRPVR